MSRLLSKWEILGFAAVAALSQSANATIIVGGLAFTDNAFADTLVSSTGNFTLGGAPDLQTAVVGSNTADYAFSFDTGANLVLKFADNNVVNGAGNDLAVFELGTPDSFDLGISVGGTTHFYSTVDTGFTGGGFSLNVAQINLDDFGVAANGLVNTIQVFSETNTVNSTTPSYTAFGALNSSSVPEPTSMLLGLPMVGWFLNHRRAKR